MEFSSQQQVAAPRDFVFAQASDFTAFERQAMRRGIEVRGRDDAAGARQGWQVDLPGSIPVLGGREVVVDLADHAPPESYRIVAQVAGIEIGIEVSADPVETQQSQLSARAKLRPLNMTGRLVMQSIKLFRPRIEARLQGRFEGYGQELEARWKRRSGA
ncbi:SRPBCC family protein [Limimaricola cinnabarinus]|uniref:Polyketide cyclase n=1 Tax=Limimaricola cinnabarinus TaxID=1125964 RepID=A0A2G1MGR3_9RHOB|nr:SRPBCC family protein [Limimaricola cinnabarinus]PHP27877.1 hypothetical protein CJ301_09415 [Limimaricola cinnabarinus]